MNAAPYSGDVEGRQAWAALEREPSAQLIDVRTLAEWNFVGLPDLGRLSRQVLCVEWQVFPEMEINPRFVESVSQAVRSAGADAQSSLFFICRSGARSRSAAIAMTEAGFRNCWNVAGGFEGDVDAEGHRGCLNGWKAAGLPWRQR
jgi:rhodanese-related sulfurtransferase